MEQVAGMVHQGQQHCWSIRGYTNTNQLNHESWYFECLNCGRLYGLHEATDRSTMAFPPEVQTRKQKRIYVMNNTQPPRYFCTPGVHMLEVIVEQPYRKLEEEPVSNPKDEMKW